MITRGRPEPWLRACALLLLTLPGTGCVCVEHGHHWLWHRKQEPKHECKPVPYWEAPCYGYYPTCWQRWPAGCPSCPPPCEEDFLGIAPEAAAEPFATPAESVAPLESAPVEDRPAIEPPPPASTLHRAAPLLNDAAHFGGNATHARWAARQPLPERLAPYQPELERSAVVELQVPPEPVDQPADWAVPEYFAPVSENTTARFRIEAP